MLSLFIILSWRSSIAGFLLFNQIGEQKFCQLLNLDVGTSLTFVLDNSGSMSDDIEAVKEETICIVDLHAGTCLAASKYVVSPFSDPGIPQDHWIYLSQP